MKTKILVIEKGKEGICIPEKFLLELELVPGSEVEIALDKNKKWLVIRPLHGEDFLGHFKDTMKSMA